VKTATLLPPPTLLDALCSHVEGVVRRGLVKNPGILTTSLTTSVKSLVRDTITTLLSKTSFLEVLRESLPAQALARATEPSDVEFWRLTVQLEALLNERSDVDIDDALSLAALSDIVVESTMAALRGG
jgi:hypothetical protein